MIPIWFNSAEKKILKKSSINELFKVIILNKNMEEKLTYRLLENIYYKNFPVLNLGKRIGATDYIDFIKKEEVTHPVMKGQDFFKRKFIVIKAIVDNSVCIQTFFQRYSDNVGLWMGANVCGNCCDLLWTMGGIKYIQAKLLKDIVEGKIVKLTEEHNPCYYQIDSILNKNIMLYDEKKWNAAKIIQRNWNFYRYNPKYEMCRRIIDGKMDKISSECKEIVVE
jgi:hypothetical protein